MDEPKPAGRSLTVAEAIKIQEGVRKGYERKREERLRAEVEYWEPLSSRLTWADDAIPIFVTVLALITPVYLVLALAVSLLSLDPPAMWLLTTSVWFAGQPLWWAYFALIFAGQRCELPRKIGY